MPGRKKVWSEALMMNCDVICGADKKQCGIPSPAHHTVKYLPKMQNFLARFMQRPLGCIHHWVALQCKVAYTLGFQIPLGCSARLQRPLGCIYPWVSDTLGLQCKVAYTLGFQIPLGFRYPWVSDSLGFQIPLGCSSRLQIQNDKNLTKDLKQKQKNFSF